MPGTIRSSKKCMKILYSILKTPKGKRQYNDRHPNVERIREWYRDQSTAQ